MQVVVKNNMKRPIAYSAIVSGKEKGQPRVQVARVLFPGSNQVDADEFKDSTKKSATWAKWINDGEVEVTEPGDGVNAIAHLKPSEAIAIVKETLNPDLLESWAAEETRADVKKAIAKQQKELEKKFPKAENAA
jgi:hypothetical protein